MSTTLALTGLMMGLAGGPHCVAMCGGACAGAGAAGGKRALAGFHLGRLAGYSTLGAVAAASVQGVGALALQTAAIRPLWTLFNVAALGLGLFLLIGGRQPAWLDRAGVALWRRVQGRGLAGAPLVVGFFWALMPCGLLYSALTVAALAGGPADGATVMALFAFGSGIPLLLGPMLWLRLKDRAGGWAIRFAGLALAITAGWGVWLGMTHGLDQLCATP